MGPHRPPRVHTGHTGPDLAKVSLAVLNPPREPHKPANTTLCSQIVIIRGQKRVRAVVSQDEDRWGSRPHSAGPNIPGGAPEGRAMGTDICDESATRRVGGQPAGHRWHTLVPCTLTMEYRPVRPQGEARAGQ